MSDLGQQRNKSSLKQGDGVRVIVKKKSVSSWGRILPIVALLSLGGLAYLLMPIVMETKETMVNPELAPASTAQALGERPAAVQASSSTSSAFTQEVRSVAAPENIQTAPRVQTELNERAPEESDDLASYFNPGDPEPTGAELIQALNEAGIHTGIGAFNPPGTSPPLKGLAVPDDFELPAGFVRHHQVTDEGEPLEPILMFSPDIEYYEAAGMIPVPEDRIVTPELAPPGMPIREMVPSTP